MTTRLKWPVCPVTVLQSSPLSPTTAIYRAAIPMSYTDASQRRFEGLSLCHTRRGGADREANGKPDRHDLHWHGI
jgi:hypothetical protein